MSFHSLKKMLFMKKKALSIFIATVVVLVVAGQQNPYKFVTVDGHKMQYQVAGNGRATVVFESGFGQTLNDWDNVFSDVATFARAIRYDRMGYGGSEATDKSRTLRQLASELHNMLQQAKIPAPYTLVGHQMGGAIIRAFADQYKEETAGLVLVDPFQEFEVNEVPEEVIARENFRGDSAMKQMPAVFRNEFQTLRNEISNGFPEMKSLGPSPDVPTVLLVGGKGNFNNWQKNQFDFFQSKFTGLADSRMILIPQSPHYIQSYDPVAVIESIRRVVFPDPERTLRKILLEKGIDSTISHYNKLKADYPKDLLREKLLNSLGYAALNKGDYKGAIKLLSLNVQRYPNSYNVYDSIAEAYLKSGNKDEAIKNYQRSYKMNPGNAHAKKMLEQLNGR
jgi:pimeloyl-ACP methyl ester carboxylesterase